MEFQVDRTEMLALEDRVIHALETCDDSDLEVLGYGEVTLVLKHTSESSNQSFAVKRLPIFPNKPRFEAYRVSLESYLAGLDAASVNVAPTQLWSSPRSDGSIVAYCIQEALSVDKIGHNYLHQANAEEALAFFAQVFETVCAAVTPMFGLDSQVANWVVSDDGLVYLDITTPVMRKRPGGAEMLDVKLFMKSLPWGLRDVVRITMTKDIFDKFYSVRGVILDLLGNLHKEGLERFIVPFLEYANSKLDDHITEADVRAYYDEDAKLWALIQKLRKADRFLQNKVLGRTYPFLLPGAIDSETDECTEFARLYSVSLSFGSPPRERLSFRRTVGFGGATPCFARIESP